MAHAFDTSLTRAQRTLIRNGAVTLLSGLLRPAGYLQAVIPWGGVVRGFGEDADGLDMLWSALAGRAPAIAISLGDRAIAPAGMGGFNFKADLDLFVYFVSNHPRDMELGRNTIDVAGLAANTADPGLDVMLEHAEELLIGQRCGASDTIKQIVPTREEECRTEAGMSLWLQRYTVTVGRTINPHRGITEIIEELRANVRTSDSTPTVIAAAPGGATMVGAVATFTTTTAHELATNAVATVSGVAVAGYNGTWLISATPTPTTFTATLDASGLAASGGGQVTAPPVVDTQSLTD